MVMNLLERDGKKFTRIKMAHKEVEDFRLFAFSLGKPVKKSSRYVYWEVEGDLLNKKPKQEASK